VVDGLAAVECPAVVGGTELAAAECPAVKAVAGKTTNSAVNAVVGGTNISAEACPPVADGIESSDVKSLRTVGILSKLSARKKIQNERDSLTRFF